MFVPLVYTCVFLMKAAQAFRTASGSVQDVARGVCRCWLVERPNWVQRASLAQRTLGSIAIGASFCHRCMVLGRSVAMMVKFAPPAFLSNWKLCDSTKESRAQPRQCPSSWRMAPQENQPLMDMGRALDLASITSPRGVLRRLPRTFGAPRFVVVRACADPPTRRRGGTGTCFLISGILMLFTGPPALCTRFTHFRTSVWRQSGAGPHPRGACQIDPADGSHPPRDPRP